VWKLSQLQNSIFRVFCGSHYRTASILLRGIKVIFLPVVFLLETSSRTRWDRAVCCQTEARWRRRTDWTGASAVGASQLPGQAPSEARGPIWKRTAETVDASSPSSWTTVMPRHQTTVSKVSYITPTTTTMRAMRIFFWIIEHVRKWEKRSEIT